MVNDKWHSIILQREKIKKSVTVAVSDGNSTKKIFKIIFDKTKGDFYVTFPYFHSSKFSCGIVTLPAGVEKQKFNAVASGESSTVPVKFSYHEDGKVHFKPNNPDQARVAKGYKLASIESLPISDLDGRHIITVQFEGLNNFDDLENEGEGIVAKCITSPQGKSFRFVAYAGFSEEDIRKKFIGNRGYFDFNLKRKGFKKDLIIRLGLFVYPKSIQDGTLGGSYLFAMVGFKISGGQKNGEIKSLYLYGKE